MKGYFEAVAVSLDGEEGKFFCQVDEGVIVRHVSIFGGVYYWATPRECFDERYDFTDKPEFLEGEGVRIARGEFDRIWALAMKQTH